MAALRSKTSSFSLFLAVILGVVLCFLAIPSLASQSQSSESKDSGLICHTSDPKDCYPKIFIPTDEFQTIRDDQDIPSGLHVRMNIWTGLKEAKIHVPGETNPALEGLPVDQAVVLVEQEQPELPPIPKDAPKYENTGKVKEPRQHEAIYFAETFKMLKSGVIPGDKEFDHGLEGLEELSHDIYYGLKFTEDVEVVKSLMCLMVQHDLPAVKGATPRDQQAAAILAGALQNNPSALDEVAKEWANLMNSKCPKDDKTLGERFYSSFVPTHDLIAGDAKMTANKVKAKVSAINGLIKSSSIRQDYLQNGGMKWLLQVLEPEKKEWETAQRKAGQLVLDTFLDENMGAVLGQWPRIPKTNDNKCSKDGEAVDEGCWDYWVNRIMKANKGNRWHWSRDLHDRLGEVRKAEKKSSKHDEL